MAPYPWGQGTYPGDEYVSTPYRVQKRPVVLSLWRNRLARSAVNRKVGGSSPLRDADVAVLTLEIDLSVSHRKPIALTL